MRGLYPGAQGIDICPGGNEIPLFLRFPVERSPFADDALVIRQDLATTLSFCLWLKAVIGVP